MAQEINKREQTGVPESKHLDPFTAMRAEMDRVFDNFLGGRWSSPSNLLGGVTGSANVPDVDVRESESEIVVEAELPGMDEKDIDVTLKNGVLSIKGEKKTEHEEKKDDYHVRERSYGSFQRSFRMPDTIDDEQVSAKFENGVLRVALSKRAEAVKNERKIPIGDG